MCESVLVERIKKKIRRKKDSDRPEKCAPTERGNSTRFKEPAVGRLHAKRALLCRVTKFAT